MLEFSFSLKTKGGIRLDVSSADERSETDDWTMEPPEGPGWERVCLSRAGALTDVGEYRWKTEFALGGPLPKILQLHGLSGVEAQVWLNGVFLGAWPQKRPNGEPYFSPVPSGMAFSVENAARPGKNLLSIHAALIGRHNTGRPIHAGILQPPVYFSERREIELRDWETADTAEAFSENRLNSPDEAFESWPGLKWRKLLEDDLSVNENKAMDWGKTWHSVKWHRACAVLPKGQLSFLELPPCDQAWAYVDKKLVGMRYVNESKVFELTGHAAGAEAEIAVACRYDSWLAPCELRAYPRLVFPDGKLDGPWFLQRTPYGGESVDLSRMSQGILKDARFIAARHKVEAEIPEGLSAPVYVELGEGWETHAVIYWNGEAIGRYAKIGPDRRFYVASEKIRKTNELLICVNGYGKPASIGEVFAGVYSRAARFELEARLD
jgi:hypothetical protein